MKELDLRAGAAVSGLLHGLEDARVAEHGSGGDHAVGEAFCTGDNVGGHAEFHAIS